MKKLSALIILTIGLFIMGTNAYGQLGLGLLKKIPDKDERRANQLEKSPAKDQIQLVEKEISSLQNSFNGKDWDERNQYMKQQKDYDAVVDRLKKMEDAMSVIKEKDPKWADKNDYSADVSGIKSKYDSKLSAYKDWKKEDDKKNYLENKAYTAKLEVRDKFQKLYTPAGLTGFMIENFNYAETKQKMGELAGANPALKEGQAYKTLQTFFEIDFPVFANKDLPEVIERKRSEAMEDFERDPAGSYEKLNRAMEYCKIMKQAATEYTVYASTLKQLEELNGKFSKYMDEKVFTGPMHKKYAGQTLLSNKPIIAGKEKEEDFKTEFKDGEPVFAITYFKQMRSAEVEYMLFVNGDIQKGGNFMDRSMSSFDKLAMASTFTYMIIPDAAYAKTRIKKGTADYHAFMITDRILGKMSSAGEFADKKYKIMLDIKSGGTKNVSFTIDASAGFTGTKKLFDDMKKLRAENLRLPKSAGANAEISAAFTSALTAELGGQVLKVVLTEAGWIIRKNKYNSIVTSREGVGYAIIKDKTGKCYMYGGVVKQEKAGAAFGKAQMREYYEDFDNVDGNYYHIYTDGKDGANGESEGWEINCANANK